MKKITIKIDDFEYTNTLDEDELEGVKEVGEWEYYDIAVESAWYLYKRHQEGY